MPTVLVVDDHVAVARAVHQLVEGNGYESFMVHDGAAALTFVRSRPVDLMVLDVMMPGMSGLDVLRELAAEGMVPALPVIMFSASDFAREEALRLGAAEFVLKGESDLLIARLEHYLNPVTVDRAHGHKKKTVVGAGGGEPTPEDTTVTYSISPF